MKKAKQHRAAIPVRPPVQTQNAHGRIACNGRLAQLQRRADHSLATQQLHTVQRRANSVLQLEVVKSDAADWAKEDFIAGVGRDTARSNPVDKSSITGNAAAYDVKGNLAQDNSTEVDPAVKAEYLREKAGLKPTPRKDRQGKSSDPAAGVGLWAAQEYLMAPVQVMVSMVDGKIGSIYFEGGRVRTTHGSGPTKSDHSEEQVFQYNIEREAAFQEYHEDGAKARDEINHPEENPERLLNRWIARRLRRANAGNLPTWAYPLDSLDDALQETANPKEVDEDGLKLFEVMVRPDGRAGYHPSRGAGVKSNLQITRAQLMQLKKAAKMFEDAANPRLANQLFYNYVTGKLPHLLPYLRHPDDIRYRPGQ